jgi:hypothetical protein
VLQNNQWNFTTNTYNGKLSKTYLNGYYERSDTWTNNWNYSCASSNCGFQIGYGMLDAFVGNIDYVRIYNRVLSDDEVRYVYERTKKYYQ